MKKFIITLITISAGALLGSLLLFPSDYWKIYLTIFVLCVSIKMSIFDNQ